MLAYVSGGLDGRPEWMVVVTSLGSRPLISGVVAGVVGVASATGTGTIGGDVELQMGMLGQPQVSVLGQISLGDAGGWLVGRCRGHQVSFQRWIFLGNGASQV